MEIKELVCIGCPLGCRLTASLNNAEVIAVTGNTCPRGLEYAHKELTNPTRIVTSTVPVIGGTMPVVSVKTQCAIPKNKITACMKALKHIIVTAPVQIGESIHDDIAGTGVAIVATKSVASTS